MFSFKFIGMFFIVLSTNCVFAKVDHRNSGKYPVELHERFRDRVSKNRATKMEGVWSSWSPWTSCSRSCGGGVTLQTRECVSRPADSRSGRGRRRKHLETNEVTNHCVGVYKRYHLCNIQDCPNNRDYRAEQCASFNARPFRGRLYFWEPFLKPTDECALNCRAVGMGFYATLNQTAKDGTSCFHPMTSHLQIAPSGTKGVCISGLCKSVSADGVIGAVGASNRPGSNSNSPANLELCPACLTGCRTISGLFTRPQLPPGYSLVTQIPKGACRLIVAQLKNTRNFIALRNPNGTFILNGDPREMGSNREVESSGTRFVYRKQEATTPETITATGPLAHPVDIMMVYNQPNPGIKYEFMLPVEQVIDHIAPPLLDGRNRKTPALEEDVTEHPKQHHTPHRHHNELTVETRRFEKPLTTLSQGDDSRPLRRRRRKFVWKINGMSSCSKSCGAGVQHPQIICVREHNQTPVIDRRCAGLERPRNQTVRCNTHSCPAYWGGTWSACSTTCGPGEQTRILECLQEITISLTVRVKDTSCNEIKPTTVRRCDVGHCENLDKDNELIQELPQWSTDPWSQCSVTCGSGQRTRSVTCNGRCRPEDRPPHLEPCFAPPCTSAHTAIPAIIHHSTHSSHSNQFTPHPQISSSTIDNWWLVSDWTDQCSQQCGTGVQTRWVTCPTGECDSRAKPESSRSCSSDKQCGGRWFTGPWGACSESCGVSSKQTREVLCVVLVRGQARIVSDMTCPAHEKPVTEKSCDGVCLPRWFTGEWGPCEGLCPNGHQRREVRCLQYDGRYSTGCFSDMPALRRNCHCSGGASNGLSTKTDYSSRESTQAQDEPLPDHLSGDCVDQFSNCQLVVQARLCQYQYYKTSCCQSCRKNPQEGKE